MFVNSSDPLRGTNWTTRLSRRKTDGRKKRKEVYVQGGTLSRRKGPGQRKFCEQAEVLKSAMISIWATRKSLARVAFFSTGIRPFCTFAVKRSSSLASKINLATIIDDSSCNEIKNLLGSRRFQDFVQVNMTISIFMKFWKINFLKDKTNRKKIDV